ncbi:MAG: DNA polymerase III subunit delta [Moraxella sp.]|nr:DNA polymerase III subunit delta [Moraxella sp.]
MQQRFLPLMADLKNKSHHLTGLWLVHGDEPLLFDWLVQACRPHWQTHNQIAKRMELTAAKSWVDVLGEINDLSLFGDENALIISGNHKPDKTAQAALEKFAQDVRQGHTAGHLLWCLPKQDKKSLATKAIRLFDDCGLIIDANVYNEQTRLDILKLKSAELGLMLSHDAWQVLLSHTEHNLLSAYQNLWRLSYTHANASIDVPALMAVLIDGADFTVFHLSDSVIAGDAQKSLTILNHLKRTDTAPSIILWALAKDARLILQISAGKNPSELGIWQNKIHSYQTATKRTHHAQGRWIQQIYDADKAIKGVSGADVWHKLTELTLSLCGMVR